MKFNPFKYSIKVAFDRVDKLLVDQKAVATRTQAQRLIASGAVKGKIQGQWVTIVKPAQKIPVDTVFDIGEIEELKYVSRAGLKLEKALDHLVNINLQTCLENLFDKNKAVIDIGQSTGGFTDCLLQKGNARIIGIDVGHSQLAPSLRGSERVHCIEGINAREIPQSIKLDYAPQGFDAAVVDVSFISQTLILKSLKSVTKPSAIILSLVKPQFEVGKDGVDKGGIVKDANLFHQIEHKIKSCYLDLSFDVLAYFPSELPGTDGNQEFFILAKNLG